MTARPPHTALVALLLTFIAGQVDIVGWLSLSHLYTANMSGNTLAIGLGLARGDLHHAFRFLFPVVLFMTGLLLCGAVQETATRRRAGRPVLPFTLLPEAALLAVVLLYGWRWGLLTSKEALTPSRFYLLAGLTALAMGLQNGTLTRLAGQTVRTTHVTGALVTLAEALVRYGFRRREARRGRRCSDRRRALNEAKNDASRRLARLMASQWLSYVAGALAGVLLSDRFGAKSLLLPIGLLFAVSAAEVARPSMNPSHTVVRRLRLDRRQRNHARP